MKTIFTLLIFVGFNVIALGTNPKEFQLLKSKNEGGKCFDGNTHIVNLGIGLGRTYYAGVGTSSNYSSSPSITISYEQPWSKKIGPGYLGVGGLFGFQTAHYRYNYNYYYNGNGAYFYEHRWNYYILTGRAAYHWDVLNWDKAEVYGGLIIGARFQSYSYTSNDPYNDHHDVGNSAYPAFSAFAGARYYFTKNIGVYAELGSGISYATGGLSIKF